MDFIKCFETEKKVIVKECTIDGMTIKAKANMRYVEAGEYYGATVKNEGTPSNAILDFEFLLPTIDATASMRYAEAGEDYGVNVGKQSTQQGDIINFEFLLPKQSQLDFYPVGAVYMSFSNVPPSAIFGGTWEKIENVFLFASGGAIATGETGGSSAHSHSLGGAGKANAHIGLIAGDGRVYADIVSGTDVYDYNAVVKATGGQTTLGSSGGYNVVVGGNTDETETIPPYIAVNMWKRIS